MIIFFTDVILLIDYKLNQITITITRLEHYKIEARQIADIVGCYPGYLMIKVHTHAPSLAVILVDNCTHIELVHDTTFSILDYKQIK